MEGLVVEKTCTRVHLENAVRFPLSPNAAAAVSSKQEEQEQLLVVDGVAVPVELWR